MRNLLAQSGPQAIDWLDPVARHPLNDGLVSWWLPVANHSGGTLLRDLLRRNHGTLTNGPTWGAGPNGFGAVQFDGVNDYGFNTSGAVNLTRVTVAAWVRINSLAIAPVFSFCNGLGSGVFDKTLYCRGGLANFNWYCFDGSGKAAVGGTAVAGRWTLLTGTADGTTSRLYQDGVQVASVACGNTYAGYTVSNLMLGGFTGEAGTGYLAQTLGSVWVYDRALTLSEHAGLYDQCRRGHPDTLRRVRGSWFLMGDAGGGGSPVTVTPDPAVARATAVAPTVVLGSLSLTPTHAAARALAVAPAVVLGSVSLTPAPAVAVAAAVAPTVTLGGVSVSPATAAAKAVAVSPTVVLGSVSMTPTQAVAKAAAVAPTVVLGSVSVTPSHAAARALAPNPTVSAGGGVSVTPDPAAASVTAVAPTVVLGSVSVSPGNAAARALALPPNVVLGSTTYTPVPAAAKALAVAPTVRLGSVTLSPSHAAARTLALSPTVVIGSGGAAATTTHLLTGTWEVPSRTGTWEVPSRTGTWEVPSRTGTWTNPGV